MTSPPSDPIERAHLRDESGSTPVIHRYEPGPTARASVRRYWIPVWSFPEGVVSRQRVLQYPVCLVVVTPAYARLVGPTRGLGVTELTGTAWAFGVMLRPSAGWHVVGGDVASVVDTHLELGSVPVLGGATLADRVRQTMADDPGSVPSHHRAIDLFEAAIGELPSPTEEDALVDELVAWVEDSPDVQRVSQVCARFGLTERALQRLTRRRVGLSPKWLIQRRRLHEASAAMAGQGDVDLARLAAELGYADQAHFTRDFRTVTGMTRGGFAAQPRPDPQRVTRGTGPAGG